MRFIDREGNPANIDYEKEEQFLVRKYLPKDAQVLELGARYGTVSCVISEVIQDPTKHVAVEPDPSVIEALTKNRRENGGKFHIYEGVISRNGYELQFIDPKFEYHEYGTHTKMSDNPTVENKSLDEIEKKYNLHFDCVVADCEGFFYDFVKENKERIKNMRVIIYEQDGVPWSDMIPKYEELDDILEGMNFKRVFTIPHQKYKNNPHFHNVWVKDKSLHVLCDNI
jgi:FkbM family methyltransferase|tara:strand:+ start:11605 stop:12282 length:678 start_codon:yes stop_codon:yes gene_type:complete